MTFLVLLYDSKEIISCSLVRFALYPYLLNLHLKANDTSAIHPTVQTKIVCDIEEKQRTQVLDNLKHQRQDSLHDRTYVHLDQDLHCNDSILPETFDVPNTFVYLRDDGKFNPSIHPEKPSKVPLWKGF